MKDEKKFRLSVIFAAALCVFAIAYNIAEEYVLPDIENYIQRRLYYEKVISRKGLSMHEAKYWREQE